MSEENREQLLAIRRGEYSYDTIIEEAESKIKLMDEVYDNSSLPEKVDFELINSILLKMRKIRYRLE